MPLRLNDTLSGRTKAVRATPGRPIALYVCGPTVYAAAHVGHARTYLEFDLVRRTLEADGQRVRHVMNITDIEDKLELRARDLGVTWRALARSEERAFVRDMDALGILRPQFQPRASDFVPEIIRVARRLERTGRVHRQGNDWMYRPPDRPAGRNFPVGDALAAHAVPEPGHPLPTSTGNRGEFMIWRRQEAPHPSWPSPWGRGGPGWHLECYAMAQRYLGIPVDVHGGGRDLIFPHHYAENEIALALDQRPFSRLFVHLQFVLQRGNKMAKSTGNLVSIDAAVRAGSARGLRWYLLGRPYTEPVEWSQVEYLRAVEEFEELRATLRRWRSAGAGGRLGAPAARAMVAGVGRDLVANLRTDRAVARIREFGRRLGRDPSEHVARGERRAVTAALKELERRTGLPLI
jgi:cysteinyl-tRNA synthetase